MKLIINITADPSELMAISRELAGNMKAKPDIDVLSAAVAKEIKEMTAAPKWPAGRPKKTTSENEMDKEIETKIFG